MSAILTSTDLALINDSIALLIKLIISVGGVWGGYKVVMEILGVVTKRHDKEKKWGEWEENLQKERDKIYERYDGKLAEMEQKIDSNHADTEAKIQQTRAELYILTECMAAVLDGLKQMGANGKVTEAKQTLDAYLIKRAHE